MNIKQAKICLDCDEIYDELLNCPICGGRVGWYLKDWIGEMQELQWSAFESKPARPAYLKSA